MCSVKRCSQKGVRKIHKKKPLVCKIFENTFFTEHLLLKWGTANSVWKISDEYSLSRNTNLRSTVQVYHFFFQQDKLSVYVSLDYTAYYEKQPSEQRCSVKKDVLKDFENFLGKQL